MRSDGTLPRIVLQFALEQRDRGSSSRLENQMRRISALYTWYSSKLGIDFEQMIVAGTRPQLQHVRRALNDYRTQEIGNPTGESLPQLSAGIINDCITAWGTFFEFAVLPDNWQSGPHPLETDSERTTRRDYLRELSFALAQLRVPESPSKPHEPFTAEELLVVEAAVIQGKSQIFSPVTRPRNALMYRLIRSGGIRISELLKLKHEHLPELETRSQKLLRELSQRPRTIRIVRQPDDPTDPRATEPNVKRGDRTVELPDRLMSDLLAFAQTTRVAAHDFILRRQDHDTSPLSLSRAQGIAKQIQSAIRRECRGSDDFFFNWHRLRATRVVEAVSEFFPDGIRTQLREQAFCAYFGWASLASAEPYLKSLVFERKAASFERQQQRRRGMSA